MNYKTVLHTCLIMILIDYLYCIRTLARNSWIHYTDYWIVK